MSVPRHSLRFTLGTTESGTRIHNACKSPGGDGHAGSSGLCALSDTRTLSSLEPHGQSRSTSGKGQSRETNTGSMRVLGDAYAKIQRPVRNDGLTTATNVSSPGIFRQSKVQSGTQSELPSQTSYISASRMVDSYVARPPPI